MKTESSNPRSSPTNLKAIRCKSIQLFGTCLLFAVIALAAPLVFAAPSASDEISATESFKAGRKAREAGDNVHALEHFRAAYALFPTPVIGLEAARVHVALGQFVQAKQMAMDARALPERKDETKKSVEARVAAQALIAEVSPKIATLSVRITDGDGATLRIDLAEVPRDAWGAARKVDPGRHVISLRRGEAERKLDVTLAAGESKTFDLAGPSAPLAVPSASAVPSGSASSLLPPFDKGPPIATGSTLRVIGWSSVIVGGLGLGLSGVIGLSAKSRYDEGASDCTPKCGEAGLASERDARNTARTATIVASVGAAFVVAGVVLVLATPSRSTSIGIGPGSFTIAGSF